MATASDFRNGLCLLYQGAIHTIIAMQHVKPGKGGAYYATKLRNLENGKIMDHTFSVGEKIETARVEMRNGQYLYKDQQQHYFMDKTNFDTLGLPTESLSDVALLKNGQEVKIIYHVEQDKALGIELPPFVYLTVTYVEPAIRGNTVNKALKKATVETGMSLLVPLFIKEGDLLKINSKKGTYEERSKQEDALPIFPQ